MLLKPIKVIDVELSSPIETIQGLHGYSQLQALVRFHRTPVGFVKLPINDGRCMAESLARAIVEKHSEAITRHLLSDGLAIGIRPSEFRLEDLVKVPHPVYTGPLPTVTVAVCTRNRTAGLKRCLDSLNLLNYPGLEIVVVDNAPSDDSTARLVVEYPYVRYVREPRPRVGLGT